jgi:hypothetical protein
MDVVNENDFGVIALDDGHRLFFEKLSAISMSLAGQKCLKKRMDIA